LPKIWHPKGLVPVNMEGWGEVQTPFRWCGSGPKPDLGDPIIARHSKGGELAERFAEFLLIRDGEIVAREPSYRGMGQCFG
jgi:D-serine deaminase-like pyridoxal phosphate-dependent protein